MSQVTDETYNHLLPEHRAAVARAAQNYFEWYARCEQSGALNEAPNHPDLIELETLGAKYDIVYEKALAAAQAADSAWSALNSLAALPDDVEAEYWATKDGSAYQ